MENTRKRAKTTTRKGRRNARRRTRGRKRGWRKRAVPVLYSTGSRGENSWAVCDYSLVPTLNESADTLSGRLWKVAKLSQPGFQCMYIVCRFFSFQVWWPRGAIRFSDVWKLLPCSREPLVAQTRPVCRFSIATLWSSQAKYWGALPRMWWGKSFQVLQVLLHQEGCELPNDVVCICLHIKIRI